VSSGHHPSWERLLAWLVVGAIAANILAEVLPRVVVPITVLAVIFITVRLVLFHTRKY
jgi:hypothetical protein